jgi:hypothetical protein
MTHKTIVSGKYVEVSRYMRPVGYGFTIKDRVVSARKNSQSRREDNVARAKKRILRLTMANELRFKPIFLTLTYKENMIDRKQAVRDVSAFFRRLRVFNPNVQYLYTLEKQKRGAWHAHILLFNVPYVHISTLQRCWTHGSNDIKKTNDARHVAFYLCKYVGKDMGEVNASARSYNCSHGLEKPQAFRRLIHSFFSPDDLCSEVIYSTVTGNIILTRSFYGNFST